jgi:hypothetical protein
MKVRAALILALVLAVVLLTPRAAGAQPAGKVYPLGFPQAQLTHLIDFIISQLAPLTRDQAQREIDRWEVERKAS